MWQIWKAKNAWYFNNERFESIDIIFKSLFDYHEYKDILDTCSSTSPQNGICLAAQLTNHQDSILLFTYAGLQKIGDDPLGRRNARRASIGVAAMDSIEKLLHDHGSPIQFVGKAMIAEALAIRRALERAFMNGWKKVKILTDAKSLIDMIRKKITTSWEIEVTCEDIWKLSTLFDHVD
ncbi:hypothetical protein A4A49_55613, partial [Nicotiana attenuata]